LSGDEHAGLYERAAFNDDRDCRCRAACEKCCEVGFKVFFFV
jgi:hypothetical protein